MPIELSRETQRSLEAYLAKRGLAEEAMSDIVNEAVETFLFRQMFSETHKHNKELSGEEALKIATEEVKVDRQSRR